MREKLLNLMKNEGLKSSQLAELLEINPAGISHILAGRNKPGFDLLQKILRRFPRINPDWLLLDSDKMYRDDLDSVPNQSTPRAASQATISDGLFGAAGRSETNPMRQEPTAKASENSDSTPTVQFPISGSRTDVNIRRIVILYEDQSFESFTPTKR